MLRRLIELVDRCARDEAQAEQSLQTGKAETEAKYAKRQAELDTRLEAATQAAEAEHQDEAEQIAARFDVEQRPTKAGYSTQREQIIADARHVELHAKRQREKAKWLAESVYESSEDQPERAYRQRRTVLGQQLVELERMKNEAADLLTAYRCASLLDEADAPRAPNALSSQRSRPLPSLETELGNVDARLFDLRDLRVPRFFIGARPFAVVISLVILAGVIPAFLADWRLGTAVFASAGSTLMVSVIVAMVLLRIGRSQVRRAWGPLADAIRSAHASYDESLELAAQTRRRADEELLKTRDCELAAAEDEAGTLLIDIEPTRDRELQRLDADYKEQVQSIKERRAKADARLEEHYRETISELNEEHRRDSLYAEDERDAGLRAIQEAHDEAWTVLNRAWSEGMTEAYEAFDRIRSGAASLFPDWLSDAWDSFVPPNAFPQALRFGELSVDMHALPGGMPKSESLTLPGPARFTVPALLAFPDECSLVIETGRDGRDAAIAALQMFMLRLLTSLPPGKVRFTLIDPVGLGQSFAGFMHLADYDESHVGGKIWTEARHIEQRLADLSEHMEHVIQKYLRNEFETIEEYNEYAGEVAEPFRFLVLADFPVNVSEAAARRLASIITSGPRCGVHTLISIDSRQSIPRGFQLDDLTRRCTHLKYHDGRLVWQDPDIMSFPLRVDNAPPDELLTRLLQRIGQAAKEVGPVQVPFNMIAPPAAQRWSLSSAAELHVPLGRAGAKKLQYMTLGYGTAQHVLIAGKTGSGKSTLLHALITSIALWYSPDEVELYLVDFKKGVEFKTYAAHQLPHARVIAIESDREFGLSTLQRLDAELKRRGDLFRDRSVQDLAGYRKLEGEGPMPRILLVVDEFQEFFVEDDKVAQDAALLLDRLVRQGRAFGIHILLGSQTLAGAYTLARSTVGQMAVRIALQCAEADSYLIMNDDNAAARLLSRPGEAIYNDASGVVEGNSPFQVAWISDEHRDGFLSSVQDLAKEHHTTPTHSQIVFEGNVPADICTNEPLRGLLAEPAWPERAAAPAAWLGEPIAIKEPTAAILHAQGGANVMIVGQREDVSLAMLATAIISLAAQRSPQDARFCILDGSPPDSPNADYLGALAEMLPHRADVTDWRNVPDLIGELAGELARRQDSHHADGPAIYLIIYALQRFRALRRSEDDFSFSMGDEAKAPAPDKQFTSLLRDGPNVGIHTLTWCDTVNTLDRALDRTAMREFETRILFQMSASDSSHLIDSPIAGKLGLRRALFYSEERGFPEKFRPYALPTRDWLAHVGDTLRKRPTPKKRRRRR